MGTNTTKLDLRKPGENDFYNQQTEQADNWDKVDKFADDIQKNVDFNLLATLGIEYGGILNNTEAKVAGEAYYDTAGKKIYKCIANTSVNYADASFFEALSNNDRNKKIIVITKTLSAQSAVNTKVKIDPIQNYESIGVIYDPGNRASGSLDIRNFWALEFADGAWTARKINSEQATGTLRVIFY